MTAHASPRRIVGTPTPDSSVRQASHGPETAAAVQVSRWMPGPVNISGTFRCAACDKPSSNQGKKLHRVRGLKTWVCRACHLRLTK